MQLNGVKFEGGSKILKVPYGNVWLCRVMYGPVLANRLLSSLSNKFKLLFSHSISPCSLVCSHS